MTTACYFSVQAALVKRTESFILWFNSHITSFLIIPVTMTAKFKQKVKGQNINSDKRMQRADLENTHIHHSIHFLLLCTHSLEYKYINSVLFTFVRHRWSQNNKCDVRFSITDTLKCTTWIVVYLQQPASFISLMRSASPQVERRSKGLPVHEASTLFPFSETQQHVGMYVTMYSHRCTRSIGVQPSMSNRNGPMGSNAASKDRKQ